MQFIKHIVAGSALLLASGLASAQFDKKQEASLKAVGNADLSASLIVNDQKIEVKGQSSFHLSASREEMKEGVVTLGALNFVFFDVPQAPLNFSGDRGEQTGNLSFALDSAQRVKYDAKSNTLSGAISGVIGASYMADYAEPIKDSKEGDHNFAPRQKSMLQFEIQLAEPLAMEESEKPILSRAKMSAKLSAEADQRIAAHAIDIRLRPVYEIEHIFWPIIEVAKRLCVQPVRFSRYVWNWPNISVQYTGDGLAFGQPEANKQWAKADVVFTWRPFKTVYNPSLFFFSTSEATSVLNTVDDADCVEVFFVEGDNGMHTGWGGGASFYGGESYTKIISSDGQADGGIDKVHLAHELGHSMDLPHPNYYNSSSTNTLMCPSGWLNDNPARNSQENKDNISNPLFTFALKVISAGPDCTNSADCGSCP